jgi:ubiquinone/menaquinone biosynthesis C-methylase UbiE
VIGFEPDDLQNLRCPGCHGELHWKGTCRQGYLANGVLECDQRHIWRIKDGIPNLADRSQMTVKDQLLDVVYDALAPFHDLSVEYFLPIVQFPDGESSRENFISAMKLKRSDVRTGSRPKRILEVGVGTGANLPLIRYRTRKGEKVDLWAVDLNDNMIAGCAEANRSSVDDVLRLAHADAHSLPFADSTFDRVLHVGGINIYRDPRLGLAEMARVAKPGTPIVVVDEGLDPNRNNTILHRLAFRWLTSLDEFSHAPIEFMPEGCELIEVYNASRFYYCMVYQKLAEPTFDPI